MTASRSSESTALCIPHLEAGADKGLISAPPKGDGHAPQLVYGVSHDEYDELGPVSTGTSETTVSVNSKTLVDAGV